MIEFITRLFNVSKKKNDFCDDFQDINDDLDFYANKIQNWYRKILNDRRNEKIGNILKKNRSNLRNKKDKKKKKRKRA